MHIMKIASDINKLVGVKNALLVVSFLIKSVINLCLLIAEVVYHRLYLISPFYIILDHLQ